VAQDTASLGRSHRSKLGKARLKKSIDDSARILGLPDDYVLGIVRHSSSPFRYECARCWPSVSPLCCCCCCCCCWEQVPASDTGAYEMAMWSMLGQRNVDMCHWESFGKGWFGDATAHLKLKDSVE
jgi:phosphoserine aminotransferase